MNEEERVADEVETKDGQLLPNREAMSLIGADPSLADAYLADAADYAPATGADSAAETASGAATDADGLASADASATEGGNVTSEDRSETLSSSDSAYAES
jgi:hypothetical protein